MGRDELMAALWSLKEDATWAWKDCLEGHQVDLHKLQMTWRRIELAAMQEDNENLRSGAVR